MFICGSNKLHNHFEKGSIAFKENTMRLGQAIFLGAAAALLALAAPTLARNSNAAKPAEAPVSASCQAYQQAADGTWTPLPCQETGSRAAPAHPRSEPESPTEQHR
jgi:hypothetical protein